MNSCSNCSIQQATTVHRALEIHELVPYDVQVNPYPTAFPYGNGMVLHFYQQQESSMTKNCTQSH